MSDSEMGVPQRHDPEVKTQLTHATLTLTGIFVTERYMVARGVCLAITGFITSLLFSSTAFSEVKTYILAIDRKHDHVLNQQTLKRGEDFLLIKVNPPDLTPEEIVFQTDKYNVYTTATVKDLEDPHVFKKLWVAKLTPKNTIKVYTIANLGYKSVQIRKNAANQSLFYLVGDHGREDQVMRVYFVAPYNPIYNPEDEKKKEVKPVPNLLD